MKSITVIGTGYVGLVTGVCLADLGNQVKFVDKNQSKIDQLKQGYSPFFEPGLQEKLQDLTQLNRISFFSELSDCLHSEFIFVAVGTPTLENGDTYVNDAIAVVTDILNWYKQSQCSQKSIIVIKSTVPIGFNQQLVDLIKDYGLKDVLNVISNPEFLREGSALHDFFNADRIVIGGNNDDSKDSLKQLYMSMKDIPPIFLTSFETAELAKYAANTFLSIKVSFINEISNLCEHVGGNIKDVSKILGSDKRIGPHFLMPGPGFGGSCFPKDTLSLRNQSLKHHYQFDTLDSVLSVNKKQKEKLIKYLDAFFPNGYQGLTISILGLTFKANTDDVRESSSLFLIQQLLDRQCKIKVFDPKGMPNTTLILGDTIEYADNSYDAVQNSDAVVILTEWNLFKNLDLKKVKTLMKQAYFFDFRGLYSKENLDCLGFKSYVIGNQY
ncbi:UDP-glucose 6-dehydrogenase [Candidatus Marinamargulisbacteria bacterium SCGC AG-410-N11]|nr:UDP-glucose 6-dehydrogenase [Candidatus Marinamargulisbacteria bacterium SCGC AG-410-N11]